MYILSDRHSEMKGLANANAFLRDHVIVTLCDSFFNVKALQGAAMANFSHIGGSKMCLKITTLSLELQPREKKVLPTQCGCAYILRTLAH